jgi:fructokinase
MDRELRIGVDLGGTKTEAVVLRVARDAHEVLARLRIQTQRDSGYEHVLLATAQIVADVTQQAGLAAPPPVGIGMPGSTTLRRADGSFSDVPLVKNSNTTCLNGRPFHRDLRRALCSRFPEALSIEFANDANCFALAEAVYGAARGARVMFGVILGTGVGGGLVFHEGLEARVWEGTQGIAGEWGHVTLEPSAKDRPCYCGRFGCIEQWLSGPAIERAYARLTGTTRAVADIAARAGEDADARSVLEGLVDMFGRAVGTVINILDPDVIVLGGGVSNLSVLYDKGPMAVSRWVFNDEVRTVITKNALGDSAGVIGAALLNPVE